MSGDNDSSTNNPQVPPDDDWLKAAHDWWSLALADAGRAFRARLDREARKPIKPVEPAPLTDFDRHFQEHVSPKLLNLIVALAPMVQRDVYDFSEACHAVWRFARKRGATHLSDQAHTEWREWIACELVARLDDPWPDDVITPERLARITGEG